MNITFEQPSEFEIEKYQQNKQKENNTMSQKIILYLPQDFDVEGLKHSLSMQLGSTQNIKTITNVKEDEYQNTNGLSFTLTGNTDKEIMINIKKFLTNN